MNPQAPKPGRGCLFYGCIAGAVLLVVVLGGVLLGLHYVKTMVIRVTDAKPMELPTVQMSQAEAAQVKARFESFQQAVREQRPTKPLALTANDLNALIAGGGEQGPWKGKVYVGFHGDQLKGQVSVPLQDLGLSLFAGRYLNGSATFSLAFHSGQLSLMPLTILAKGQPVPEVLMQQLRRQNLAVAITNDPSVVAVLAGLAGIQVTNDELVLAPKQQP